MSAATLRFQPYSALRGKVLGTSPAPPREKAEVLYFLLHVVRAGPIKPMEREFPPDVAALVFNVCITSRWPSVDYVENSAPRVYISVLVFTSKTVVKRSTAFRGALLISSIMRRIKVYVGVFEIRYVLSKRTRFRRQKYRVFLRQSNRV